MKSGLILLDIFSYSCMNCLRSLEYIKKINSRYNRYGLETILVHPPEWEFEKSGKNILNALKKRKIKIPIIIDKNKKIINKFKINFWPTQILIDNGKILYKHIGEGDYKALENAIIKNLKIKTNKIFNNEPRYSTYPAVYCGKRKNGNISKLKKRLKFGVVYTENKWVQNQEYIKSLNGDDALTILTKGNITNFVSKSADEKPVTAIIRLDNKFIKKIKINNPQLYNLIKIKKNKNNNNQKVLTIITPKNLCIYSFSFQ